ncbi:MAG: anhydro-N-acetylmuramic acid kinase [Bacteroidetes bacterium]|nr:anhydro-N-acetylmuramic acid kinase [Bacteroidota bacterium]
MEYSIGLGLMSGTSLDGLDIAICQFEENEGKYYHKVLYTKEIPYSDTFKNRLLYASKMSGLELVRLDHDFAQFCSEQVLKAIAESKIKPHFIASHGHTIFHDPQYGYTTQMGNGGLIAGKTGITTVSDFRTTDVGLGGEGAPLVPIGDQLLFSDYDACLNLGGIANISYLKENQRVAYDISLCNIPFNHYANQKGLKYDQNGELARLGEVDADLLKRLDALPFYKQDGPKSLGRAFFEEVFLPLTDSFSISIQDKLATIVEHISKQIISQFPASGTILITGGGAFNSYLIEKLNQKTECQLVIPDQQTIQYKEAILFAFLGYLRLHQKINTLSAVTGAQEDSIGGAVYIMKS